MRKSPTFLFRSARLCSHPNVQYVRFVRRTPPHLGLVGRVGCAGTFPLFFFFFRWSRREPLFPVIFGLESERGGAWLLLFIYSSFPFPMRGATPLPLCKRKVERRKRPRVFVAVSAVLENLKGALSPRLSAVCSVDDSFSRSLSSCCPFFIARGSGGKKEKKKNVNHQRSWLLVHGERIRRHVGFMLLASLVGQRWADAPCRISGAIFCFSRRVFSGAGLYSSNPPSAQRRPVV